MKIPLVFLSIILITSAAYGQTKKVCIPSEIMRYDTAYWGERIKQDSNEIGLPNLIKTKDTLHFRYTAEVRCIDIWTNDYKTFHGLFANFTHGNTYKREKKKLPWELYYNIAVMDTAKAREIYGLFISLNVFSIPPQDSIPGWQQGLDGIDYDIEYSTPTSYTFKYYWTPSAEGNLKEAVIMDTLVNRLYRYLNKWQPFDDFIFCLPAGVYGGGGIIGISTSADQKPKMGGYKKAQNKNLSDH